MTDPIRQWRRAKARRRLLQLIALLAAAAAARWLWLETRPEPVYRIGYPPTPPALRDRPRERPPAASPPPPTPADTADTGELAWTLGEQRDAILAAVEDVRANGARCDGQWYAPVGPLRWAAALERAAQAQADWIADEGDYAHETPDNPAGTTPTDRAQRAGYRGPTIGENLAWGQPVPDDAVDWWLGSPPHCRLLVADDVFEAGVGVAPDPESDRGWIWVLLVGG